MLDFAVKLTVQPGNVEEADRERLRRAGFSDRDIWDIAERRRLLQHVEPGGERHRHAAEHGVSRAGAVICPQRPRPFVPAQAGTQRNNSIRASEALGPRLRGDERKPMIRVITFIVALLFAAPAFAQVTQPPAIPPAQTVVARHGMVVAQEARAARIGVDILKRGGNAVDAAVAVGFALAVTYPDAGNLGGGGFMVIHLAKDNRNTTIDYRETAPAAATQDHVSRRRRQARSAQVAR